MDRDPQPTAVSSEPPRSQVNAALRISVQSAIWTLSSSSVAVTLGVRSHIAVLVAFGAIGFVDAIGSLTLVYYFRHGLRHDQLSERLEQLAHRVVLVGLLVVGCAAIVGGTARLASGQAGATSNAGVVLAGVSLGILLLLSSRKRSIALRVSSKALLSDGHLSGIGALQAGVTLAGTAATMWTGWHWADAGATTLVGCVAVALAVVTWNSELRNRRNRDAQAATLRTAFVFVLSVALVDAILGRHLILIGLLVGGPVVATTSLRPLATALVSSLAIVLAVALGAPDHIWLTGEHAVWVGAVLLVGLANTAVVTAVARRQREPRLDSPLVG